MIDVNLQNEQSTTVRSAADSASARAAMAYNSWLLEMRLLALLRVGREQRVVVAWYWMYILLVL